MSRSSDELQASRDQWRWRGGGRPPFAAIPMAGQESVWDYPRPPILVAESREIIIRWGDVEVARSRAAVRILETSHPPSFYLPPGDVATRLLEPGSGSSFCEWKGPARYWSLRDAGRQLQNVAWSYANPLPGAEKIADFIAFYPTSLTCTVGGTVVTPQPGGFYGGWITPELVGPFKGTAGSHSW
jgi:uncharacterized protein (DUF427 family)